MVKKEKVLHRSKKDYLLAGVCAGFAEYFNTDPSIIRLLWIFLFLFYGTGAILYIILWVILPQQ